LRISTRTNIDEVFRDLDAFVASAQNVAVPRALNTLRDQAQVAGLRKISEVYQIGPRTTERYLSITLASPSSPEASINVKGRGFPLSEMKPLIKGKRVLIPHAFMVKRFGLHVFARGAYGGKSKGTRPTGERFGRFVFGKGRLPMSELFTFGPAEMLANQDVTDAMQDRIEEQAPVIIAREISAVRRGF
jgi:hypothetical protein